MMEVAVVVPEDRIVDASVWSISATCSLNISASGGNGTDVGDPAAHGAEEEELGL